MFSTFSPSLNTKSLGTWKYWYLYVFFIQTEIKFIRFFMLPANWILWLTKLVFDDFLRKKQNNKNFVKVAHFFGIALLPAGLWKKKVKYREWVPMKKATNTTFIRQDHSSLVYEVNCRWTLKLSPNNSDQSCKLWNENYDHMDRL